MTTNSTTDNAPTAPAAKRRRNTWGWVTAAAVALVAGGYLTIAAVTWNSSDPAEVVTQYLEALEQGDATGAAKIVDPETADMDAAFLTDEVLGAATERIEVQSVSTTRREGDTAEVTARLGLGQQSFLHTFTVTRDGGSFWTMQSGWTPDAPLAVEVVVVANDSVAAVGIAEATIGGAALDLDVKKNPDGPVQSRSEAVWVYPGVYEVAAPSVGGSFTVTPAELVAIPPAVEAERWVVVPLQVTAS